MPFDDLNSIPVAEFLKKKIEERGLSVKDVATEGGWDKATALELILEGRLKLPINRVRPLAQALGISAANLLRIVMQEYMPETYKAVIDVLECEFLSEFERKALEAVRDVSRNGEDDVCITRSERVVIVSAGTSSTAERLSRQPTS